MTKKKKKKGVDVGGRPTAMNEEVIAKLENAFAQGLNDSDACILVGIDLTTLWRYCKKFPSFAKKKEALKRRPFLASVLGINKLIKAEDPTTLRWYAERKGKDEFSIRTEQTGAGGEALNPPKIVVEFVGVKNEN